MRNIRMIRNVHVQFVSSVAPHANHSVQTILGTDPLSPPRQKSYGFPHQVRSCRLNCPDNIIIVVIIPFKDAIRDFLNAPRTVSNTYAQVARAQSSANHVQYIQRLSRATCRVSCHVVRRDSSAIKFDRVEIAFIWLNHKPMKEGRKPGYPEKNPWQRASVLCRQRPTTSSTDLTHAPGTVATRMLKFMSLEGLGRVLEPGLLSHEVRVVTAGLSGLKLY